MGKSQVIAKLTQPTTGRVLHRQRLFDQLRPSSDAASVVFVHAPPGAGKTTLAASYAEHLGVPALWYQVDSTDEDPASLFYHLKVAASGLHAEGASRLPLLTPEFTLGIEAFARRFFRRLFSLPGPRFTLVFDNCHEVGSGSTFFELLRVAADELPPGGQLLMLSRNVPPPAFARLRVNAALVEIDSEALALTRDESRALASQHGRADLSADEVDQLSARVGSWVTGFVLALRAKSSGNSASGSHDESAQLLFDYFSTEAFRGFQQDEQALLMRLAVLPWMTPLSATTLTGSARAALMLESLAKDHHFTTHQGGTKPVFQFHALFREFLLRKNADALSTLEQRELQLLAAQLMEQEGAPAEAFDLVVQTCSWGHARELVLRNAQALMAEGRHNSLRTWLEALPTELVQGDAALSRWAGVALLPGEPEAALAHFRRAFRLALEGEDQGLVVHSWAGMVDAIFQSYSDLARLDAVFEVFDCQVAPHLHLLPMSDQGRTVAIGFLALVFRRPNHPKVLAWTRPIRELSCTVPDPQVRHLLKLQLATSHLWRGELQSAHAIVKTLGLPRHDPDSDPFIAVVLSLTHATYRLYSGEYKECAAAVESGLDVAKHSGLHIWDSILCGMGAAACLGAGRIEQARGLISRMSEYLDEARVIDHSKLLILQAWYDLADGKPFSALEQIEHALEAVTRGGVPHFRGICLLTVAEIQMCCAHLDEAQASLDQVSETILATGNSMLEWFRHLMTARLAQARGDSGSALAALAVGLRLGREHGYLHFYFWPRETLSNLFGMALAHHIETDYVHQLIARNHMLPPSTGPALVAWPWPVKVFTLGGFHIDIDGKPMTFSGKVQKAPLNLLKVLLAYGGQDVAEHRLEEALWPDSEGDAASQALATTLSRLRKLVGPEAITRHGGMLSVNTEVVWCDAQVLSSLLDGYSLEGAAVLNAIGLLYRGRFLPQDEDRCWALPMRAHIHKAVVSTLLASARRDADKGRHDEAIAACERGFEIDDLGEGFYELAMRALVATGRNAEAVRLYRQCQHELSARLGVEPSPATRRAYLSALAPASAEAQ